MNRIIKHTLSEGEPYFFHGRELLVGLVCFTQEYKDFPLYFLPTVSGTLTD